METKEESIKMLELRMRRQMSNSPEKNIKPENIQYYVASAMLHKEGGEDTQQEAGGDAEKIVSQPVYGKLRHGQGLTGEGKVPAVQKITGKFMGSEEYGNLPADVQYMERGGEIRQMMAAMGTLVTKEAQHVKAKSGYERVRQAVETGESFETKRVFPLDVKG